MAPSKPVNNRETVQDKATRNRKGHRKWMDPDSIVCPELYPPFEIIPREAGSIDLSRASNGVSSRHRQGISMPRNQDLSSLPCARRREFSTTFHDDPVSRPGNILIPIGVGTKGLERERETIDTYRGSNRS